MIDDGVLRAALLAWYDAHARDLPWRRGATPYGTLVSEVMLQQTRVETVVPYYERWLTRFPDVGALARAHEDDVLRAWEGLGYYSRARNLHRAARVVRERYAGELPADYASLRELPGIGDYTAGAVASIAFGRREPAVDANVTRVLARVLDLETPSAVELRRRAAALIDPDRPGDFNQALMELGATVCTPRSPACPQCPVAHECLARARGTVSLRPAPGRRSPIPSFELVTVVAIDDDDRVLLRRRPDSGLLARMWEFPSIEWRAGEELEDQARSFAEDLARTRLDPGSAEALVPVEHAFSHRRETYNPVRIRLLRESPAPDPPDRCVWVAIGSLGELPLPRAQRRIQRAALGVAGARIAAGRRIPASGEEDMPKATPEPRPDQETRNDDPLVQERQDQKSSGRKDQAEGERDPAKTEDARVNPEVAPSRERERQPRK